ncbi:hypothetical protein ACLB2K_003844 [Fragaria x ananassa]
MVYIYFNDITGNTLTDGTFGISVKGHGGDVVDMFCEMQRMGVPSDDHIFMSVLSTCSHCGLVDEARDNVHHYGCMANILGRAGQLNQVYQLILSRKHLPRVQFRSLGSNEVIFINLLTACVMYGDIKSGCQVLDIETNLPLISGYAYGKEISGSSYVCGKLIGRAVRLSLIADEVSHPEVLLVIKKYKSWMDGIWGKGTCNEIMQGDYDILKFRNDFHFGVPAQR